MRVALYARVSTRKDTQDVETQLSELRLWARGRKWKVVGEYPDRGISGSKERRPELDRLMRDAKAKQFDAVAVWKFDRFARSTKHLIAALEDFNSWGIHFISTSQSIDTSTPYGKLVFVVIGAVAELERELIRERVNLGITRARREGKQLGRPPKRIDREYILKQLTAGVSKSQLSREFGVSRATVMRIGRQVSKKLNYEQLKTKRQRA